MLGTHSQCEISLKQGEETWFPPDPVCKWFSKSVTIAPPMDISGSHIGVNASKVLLLHPTHAPTKFGADLSYQGKNDTDRQTDGPTDRQSLLYASPWVWQ